MSDLVRLRQEYIDAMRKATDAAKAWVAVSEAMRASGCKCPAAWDVADALYKAHCEAQEAAEDAGRQYDLGIIASAGRLSEAPLDLEGLVASVLRVPPCG